MNGNANLNANNLTTQNIKDWQDKLGITSIIETLKKCLQIKSINLAQNGYIVFTNGLQVVWGKNEGKYQDQTITYPKNFTTAFVAVVTWQKYDNTTREWCIKNNIGNGSLTMRKNAGTENSASYNYIVIGTGI